MERKSYCIVCGERRRGLPVKTDHVIDAIRWFKTNVTRNERNNVLVVCKACYPKYKDMRKRFVTRMYAYVGLGVLFAVLVLSRGFSALALVVGLLLIAALFLFSLLNYMPDLELGKKKESK